MPAGESPAEGIDVLRNDHMSRIADLLPPDSPGEDDEGELPSGGMIGLESQFGTGPSPSAAGSASSLPLGASALHTPPASSAPSAPSSSAMAGEEGHAAVSWGVRPRFNLESARDLLVHFREDMSPHFPALAWDDGSPGDGDREGGGSGANGEEENAGDLVPNSVEQMARRRPFLLLAVLAAASGNRALQGHGLYDEEFRKVLGLKFVAGGERSLELLQGLVIYCAWYPFHLRPRNKQVFQYVRMAMDIVNDLEMDQPFDSEVAGAMDSNGNHLENIRTYLATYHLTSRYAIVWRKTPSITYTQYTAKCHDILERASPIQGDRVLAWLVKLQHLAEETADALKNHPGSHNEYQEAFVLKGMESQLQEWENKMSPDVSSSVSLRLSRLFTRVFLYSAPLLKFLRRRRVSKDDSSEPRADSARLALAIPAVRDFLDFILSLTSSQINSFSSIEWASFIMVVVASVRLSFPLESNCPDWDDTAARRDLCLADYLKRVESIGGHPASSELGGPSTSTDRGKIADVLGASTVVIREVREKYERRVARMDAHRQRRQLQQQKQQQQQTLLQTGQPDFPSFGLDPVFDLPPLDASMHGCPMMDGSLREYIPYWDENIPPIDPSIWANMGEAGGLSTAATPAPAAPTPPQQDSWGAAAARWLQLDIDFQGI